LNRPVSPNATGRTVTLVTLAPGTRGKFYQDRRQKASTARRYQVTTMIG
jgi:hypothetical protein